MLRVYFLRRVFLISLALAIGLPLYDTLYIYPAYRDLLIGQTESEAGRFVRFLVATKQLDAIDLEHERLPPSVTGEIISQINDSLLVKLRIFSSEGRIVYSTQADEIGNKNINDYFINQVAKGKLYSKVVKKDEMTADSGTLSRDVVETYVPIMANGRFHGAVEVYYDITAEQHKLSSLNRRATILLVSVSAAFLLLLLLALQRAKKTFFALQQAEGALKDANESLEYRVNERTEQLRKANLKLLAEVEERTKAETSLKQALAHVSDARDKIDTILASVADGLIVTDSDDRVVLMNRVAETVFAAGDWQPGDLLSEVVKLPELLKNVDQAKRRLATGLGSEFDLCLPRNDPEERIYAVRASALLGEQQQVRGAVLLLQDVTKIRGIDRMKRELISMAAHELRTPLTMILGYSELLVENPNFPKGDVQDFIKIINEKAVALADILDDLLDVTRIEEGRPLELHLQQVAVGELLSAAIAEAKLQSPDSFHFKLDLPSRELKLEADQGRLLQVLQNLLSNAVKYSPAGGTIRLSAKLTEDEVEIAVSDQGIGMSPDQCKHAFERFYRADTSDAGVRGTGLGLSIVKYIVEAHNGRVGIESSLGQGSRVCCWFPR